MNLRHTLVKSARPRGQIPVWALLGVLVLLALTTRLLPLAISHYPYHNDSITECRIADDIIQSGTVNPPEGSFYESTHSVVTPAYNALLAFASVLIGASVFESAQFVVSVIGVLTVVGGYIIASEMSNSRKGGLTAALFLSLFGTFVFLTGSGWKESLGVALLVLLYFAYMRRQDRRMFLLEIAVLAFLPLVHHLVTVVAYLSLAYLTTWSLVFAVRNRSTKPRHYLDAGVILVPSVAAYAYYRVAGLDRLSYVSEDLSILLMATSFAVLCVLGACSLSMKTHSKLSFAPIPAVAVFALFTVDYLHPLFPYEPSSPPTILLLVAGMSVLTFFFWYGLEGLIESKSRYRAVPLGMLLPALTLLLFAVLAGSSLRSHQIVYRSFDLVDLSLAIGIGVAIARLKLRPRAEQLAAVALLSTLMITFPFGYATSELLGMRHDTQSYEVDAITWIDSSLSGYPRIESDERLAYLSMALCDYEKRPFLPGKLVGRSLLGLRTVFVLESEWMTEGVNDYPNGHPLIDGQYVDSVLLFSNVHYCGGPSSNQLTVFTNSTIGWDAIY